MQLRVRQTEHRHVNQAEHQRIHASQALAPVSQMFHPLDSQAAIIILSNPDPAQTEHPVIVAVVIQEQGVDIVEVVVLAEAEVPGEAEVEVGDDNRLYSV